MSDTATAERRASTKRPDRWFEKPGGSPADRIPAFREALADVARAWQTRFVGLAAAEGEISFSDVAVCKVDDIPSRRGPGAVLAMLKAPGWNTRVGITFDRVFVTTMVEALFGGGGEDLEASATTPLSPVDLQIADVVVRQVSEALALGFAKCLPSPFVPEGLQAKFDASFLGKPQAAVVVGTLSLSTLGNAVELDLLVPLAAMMVFAEELAAPVEDGPNYEDPRWTQRLETEISRADMRLEACVDLAPMPLGAIATLAVGQLIELPKGATGKIRLQCQGDDLFRCDLGQSAGFYTVRVEEVVGTVPTEAVESAEAAPIPMAMPDIFAPDPFAEHDPLGGHNPLAGHDPFAMPAELPDLDL